MTFALPLASTAAPQLNTAFYSVAATVIPVLYLAIAVQGDTYRAVMNYAIERDNAFWHWWRSPKSRRGAVKAVADLLLAGAIAMTIFFAVVGLGVGGEITALFALLLRVPSLAPAAFVLASATGLILIAAAPAIGWLFRWAFNGIIPATRRPASRETPDPAPSTVTSQNQAEPKQRQPTKETGKTGGT
jgi:uncharacterized membrane protein